MGLLSGWDGGVPPDRPCLVQSSLPMCSLFCLTFVCDIDILQIVVECISVYCRLLCDVPDSNFCRFIVISCNGIKCQPLISHATLNDGDTF